MLIVVILNTADCLRKCHRVVQGTEPSDNIEDQCREILRLMPLTDCDQTVPQAKHVGGLKLFKFLLFRRGGRKRFRRLENHHTEQIELLHACNNLVSQNKPALVEQHTLFVIYLFCKAHACTQFLRFIKLHHLRPLL